MKETPPCKGCGDRRIGCHSRCEAYKEWKKGVDEITAARVKERNAKPEFSREMERYIWKGWKKWR